MLSTPLVDRILGIDSLENVSFKMNKEYTKIIIRSDLVDVSECTLETDLKPDQPS